MFWLLVAVVALCAFTVFKLRGANLTWLDEPLPAPANTPPSDGHQGVVEQLGELTRASQGLRGRARIHSIRRAMDAISEGRDLHSRFVPVTEGGVRGEWVLAPGCDADQRLLYIHGGAWLAGSPRSHRTITDALSRLSGCAVFSLDYRLMPENSRRDGIEDCQQAWRWLLHNGPEGPAPARFMAVAGDSAGGNLTLSLIAWIRDEGLRQADAAVAFSPATDGTLTSPSLSSNQASDPMLGPAFGAMLRYPRPLLWWSSWLGSRFFPSDPIVSPLRGDLRDLPPVLVQASEAEMLLDDARRYVRRARAAGSAVELQTWPHMVHVWQLFTPELEEADAALAEVARFLQEAGARPPGRLQEAQGQGDPGSGENPVAEEGATL
ncbi:alpha/beta hydrolase [Parahaliea maris]|uniref:Alpha/beta hydrolase n=1 Tax=Parahaliea maris TaxID=2716870 RepID=A0A5C8ZZ81_9GAMM|nr:alpha/beta hydrolase [Parahaliea maris]TXS92830.1 alpha/beta hydrolase [Parahaliea maris]